MSLQKEINQKAQSSEFSSSRRNFLKMGGASLLAGGLTNILSLHNAEAFEILSDIKASASSFKDESYWNFIRAQFPLERGLIYMNNAVEGCMPNIVIKSIGQYFKEFAKNPYYSGITDEYYSYFMPATVENVAAFLGADADEIVLTVNATEGLTFVANGLDLQEGDEVLSTLHEHEACTSSWGLKADRHNISYIEIEIPTPAATKEEIVSAFEKAITPKTKVMSYSHINFTTGLRMPVKELCELARQHGIISVVDGAHAIGMLNLDLHDLGCDFYVCSPHKWLCAPPGTGVLYMRKDVQSLLWPTISLFYSKGKGIGTQQKELMLRGQMASPVYRCLKDVMDFQNAIGKDVIQRRVLDLGGYLKEKIIENWGEDKIFSSMEEDLSSGMVAFNPFDDRFQGVPLKNIYKSLADDYNIIIRWVWYKDKLSDANLTQTLRVSTHIYNNYSQIDQLISAMQNIIAQM